MSLKEDDTHIKTVRCKEENAELILPVWALLPLKVQKQAKCDGGVSIVRKGKECLI